MKLLKPFQRISKDLDRRHPMPLYEQLANGIEGLIRDGHLGPGSPLPGDKELGALCSVNVGTARKAFSQLVDRQLVARRRRAGTFVCDDVTIRHRNVGFYYYREKEVTILSLIEALQQTLGERQFDVKLIPFEKDFYDTVDLQADVRRRDLDAAVFVTLPNDACFNALDQLSQAGFPFARAANPYFREQIKEPLVTGADGRLVEDSLKYLHERGHERIGFVASREDSPEVRAYRAFFGDEPRIDRWLLPLEFNGLPPAWNNLPGKDQMMRGYLDQNPDITAAIVYHPCACQTLIEQAAAKSLDVPNDLSLISLRDWTRFGLNASVTAWELPREIVGEQVARALFALIDGKPVPHVQEVPFELTERESVIDRTAVAVG